VHTARVMVKRNRGSAPRALGGGQSARYEVRRAQRGSAAQYAPSWTDSAACRVLEVLQQDSKTKKVQIVQNTTAILLDGARTRMVVARAKRSGGMSAHDERLAGEQLAFYAGKVRAAMATGPVAAKKAVRSFLKPLRERRAAVEDLAPLVVEPAVRGPATLAGFLSERPEEDRLRSIERNNRIVEGLASWWPRGCWFKQPGVVCYERAAGRIANEREKLGKVWGPLYVSGLVHTKELPTLTASAGNHYVVVQAGKEPRFMSVQEVMRAFMVPEACGLWRALTDPRWLTAVEAVSALGRGIHVGVARAIVRTLVEEGTLGPGLTYASAYSGVDTFAAAVEAELCGAWRYAFASETEPKVRLGLLAAWHERGLTVPACHFDARSEAATVAAPSVDLWVITAECVEFSDANRQKSEESQMQSLSDMWKSLEYVRARRPRVVVVENVATRGVVEPLTGLLTRLEGYSVRRGVLRPQEAALSPIARKRYFWVLVRA
jgi:hypothetical protein